MTEEQIVDVWGLFKEYIDKKQLDLVAEKYVDMNFRNKNTSHLYKIGMDYYLNDFIITDTHLIIKHRHILLNFSDRCALVF